MYNLVLERSTKFSGGSVIPQGNFGLLDKNINNENENELVNIQKDRNTNKNQGDLEKSALIKNKKPGNTFNILDTSRKMNLRPRTVTFKFYENDKIVCKDLYVSENHNFDMILNDLDIHEKKGLNMQKRKFVLCNSDMTIEICNIPCLIDAEKKYDFVWIIQKKNLKRKRDNRSPNEDEIARTKRQKINNKKCIVM